MHRAFFTTAFLALTATQTAAFDIEAMSDEDRAIFRSEIRDYLLENPEVLMEAIAVLEERRAIEAESRDLTMIEENRSAIYDDGVSYVGGNPDGDVTVVEFLDYRCGYCKRAFPAVEELVASDGNIRYIVKEYPILGAQSTLAARYALAVKFVAGDEAYKTAHDTLMTHNGAVNEGFLARTSRNLGIDHDDVTEKMSTPEVDAVIQSNLELARALEIQGTPSFIMGENFVRGFVELDQMRAIIAEIRDARG